VREWFTTAQARERGITEAELRWGEGSRWRRVARGAYRNGLDEPDELDRAVGEVLRSGGVARGRLAGVLYGLDGVVIAGRQANRRRMRCESVVEIAGVPCANALECLIDLAGTLGDLGWEQALESALRKKLVLIGDIEAALPRLRRARTHGVAVMQRVLALRPRGAPATESLLETLMVQLARQVEGLGDPVRQHVVEDADGRFVARVDLVWLELGLFVELDGQQHRDQPVYDARRETAVVAATGWLCGRFTWREVTRVPGSTARRLAALAEQARRRPIAAR
jgi:very-short-patch-repair endonuclease